MEIFEKIIQEIKLRIQKNKTKLISIDGLGGSGKTSFVMNLLKLEPEFKVLELDHFPCLPEEHPYHIEGAQERVSFDRFINEALIPLSSGKPAI